MTTNNALPQSHGIREKYGRGRGRGLGSGRTTYLNCTSIGRTGNRRTFSNSCTSLQTVITHCGE